jgi:hypothetical protein
MALVRKQTIPAERAPLVGEVSANFCILHLLPNGSSRQYSRFSRQRYINITITILDIIHRLVFYLKHHVSETGFCLQVKVARRQRLYLFGPTEEIAPEDGDRIQSPKLCVLSKKYDDG